MMTAGLLVRRFRTVRRELRVGIERRRPERFLEAELAATGTVIQELGIEPEWQMTNAPGGRPRESIQRRSRTE
jgi:hypothetical protein